MQYRRYFIGQLDMDFEPYGIPSMWDLSGFCDHRPFEGTVFDQETGGLGFIEDESAEITQPLSQLVEYYDRFVHPGYWNVSSD